MQTSVDPITRKPVPVWLTFWWLFGASNQLLPALTLLSVTECIWRSRGAPCLGVGAGIPAAWMYVMSAWALLQIIGKEFGAKINLGDFQWTALSQMSLVAWIAVILVALAALMALEAVVIIFRGSTSGGPKKE